MIRIANGAAARLTAALVFLLCITPAFAGGGADPATDRASLTRVDRGAGGVTVTAVYLTPDLLREAGKGDLASGPEGAPLAVFHITLDTHAGDLMRVDPIGQAMLRIGGGEELRPVDWKDEETGSHHRSGYIRFAAGPLPSAGYAELAIKDVAGEPERLFRWVVPAARP